MALALTGLIAAWGIVDTSGLANFSSIMTGRLFTSRGWFVMLSVSFLLFLSIWLTFSPYGMIKLGKDEDEPELPQTLGYQTVLESCSGLFRCGVRAMQFYLPSLFRGHGA
jgi:glycine betaine transporter